MATFVARGGDVVKSSNWPWTRKQRAYSITQQEWRQLPMVVTDEELRIGEWQVMQSWELPLMKTLASEVTRTGGDVLEIGFGMGISASAVIDNGCRSYTVIEAHPRVAELARQWGDRQEADTRVIEGFWQDALPELGANYDGILFDTYPMSHAERHRNHFAFIPEAPRLLRPGGVLTMYSDENVNFRQEHLSLLLHHFDEVRLIKVKGLCPPPNCDYWNSDTMVIPVARKGAIELAS